MNLLIADDHPILRTGVKALVGHLFDEIFESDNGLDAYKKILAHRPDIAILDLEMPKLSGLDVCRKVLAEKNNTKFIVLTSHKEIKFYTEAMNLGVLGYLHKEKAIAELLECIATVQKGNTYTSKDLLKTLISSSENEHSIIKNLTSTEKLILKLITQGNTSAQIASEIFISVNTVDNHRSNIAKKLNLEGKNSLVKFALENKTLFDS